MAQSRLNSLFVSMVVSLLLTVVKGRAQEAINNVRMEKLNASSYKITYKLNPVKDVTYKEASLKVFRRRAGVIEEVFSQTITPANARLRPSQTYSYTWKAAPNVVIDGDELQAKVLVSYDKPAAAKVAPPVKPNIGPRADAGNDMDIQLPYNDNISLEGMRSFDEDGRIVYINWTQVSGPTTLLISSQHSYKTTVAGYYKEGVYTFEITVTDDAGASAADRVNITVKPAINVTPPPQAATTIPLRKDTAAVTVKPTQPINNQVAMQKLKGGPSNALLDLLVPGVGHYYVSGDHYGNDRKPAVLLITALYAGSVGGAIYYKLRSNREHNTYLELANYREYQKDADGNVIGVRGANQAVAERYLSDARNSHNNFLILTGVSAGIIVSDAIYTFIRGSRNKKAWEAEAKVQAKPFIFSDGTRLTAGLRVNF